MSHRRRIVIFSSYYWPEESGNAPYVTGFAEHLAEHASDVDVVTGFAHYPGWSAPGMRLSHSERHRGVRIHRRAHYVPQSQSAPHRALYEASLLAGSLSAVPLRARPDAVVAVLPTLASGLAALATAVAHRARLSVVFQDIQGRAAMQSGVPGGRRVAGVVGAMELRIARRADAVGIVAEGFRDFFVKGGVRPERIHRVRNWSNYTEPTESPSETRARLGWREDEFVCLHAGNMGRKQGLENLIDAAAIVPSPRVKFVLAGGGNDQRRLVLLARERAPNVQFLEMQPMGGPCEAMCRAADLLLVNQLPTVLDMSLPSKLTTYFSSGRPVLAAVHERSEAAREIQAAAAGRVVPPGEPRLLASAVTDALQNRASLAALGEAGRRYAEARLSRAAALREMEQRLIGGRQPQGAVA